MKEILENNFQQVYKEFKDYQSFVVAAEEEIKTEREKLPALLEQKENVEKIANKLFELQSKPLIQRQDLLNLGTRLIYVYETVKDVIDIPKEVKEEIESILPPKQHYKIEKGTAIEIDPEYSKQVKEKAREHYQEEVRKYFNKEN